MQLTDTRSEAVCDLMREAAERLILPRFRRLAEADIAEKAAKDFVTIADREAEAFLLPLLTRLLPGSVGIGEEIAYRTPTLLNRLSDDVVWLIDPLDGTRNFVEGRPDFAVMVNLVEKGRASAAWIYFPITGVMVETQLGSGTLVGGRRVVCADNPVPAKMRGAIVRSHTPPAYLDILQAGENDLAGSSQERFSAAVECLAILTGELDFGFYWRTLPWDHAPCCLAISEAGGVCRRLDGEAYRVADGKSGLIVASQDVVAQRIEHRLRDL